MWWPLVLVDIMRVVFAGFGAALSFVSVALSLICFAWFGIVLGIVFAVFATAFGLSSVILYKSRGDH
jgi:hypothetical protein